jgi:predicted ester cyclase
MSGTEDPQAALAALMARQLKQTVEEIPDYEGRVDGLRAYRTRLLRQFQQVIDSEFTTPEVHARAVAALRAFAERNP